MGNVKRKQLADDVLIYRGDCLDAMSDIPDGSVDLVACDLPYGTTACAWDSVIPFESLWVQYRRVLKPCGAVILTASQPFTSALVMSNPTWFVTEWIWRKDAGSNFATTKTRPMKEHESVIIFAPSTFTYNAIKEPRARHVRKSQWNASNTGKRQVYGTLKSRGVTIRDEENRVPSSVQFFNRERGLHPTQKPVPLFEYLIRTYSNERETVLDNTMGSGTTGIACVNTKRRFIGIEKDPEIFTTARRRLTKVLAARSERLFQY